MLNSYNYQMYPHIPKMHSKKDFYGNDGEWTYGDYILHWAGVTFENRVALAKYFMNFVIQ